MSKKIKSITGSMKFSKKVRDYSNEPVFIKKAQESKAFLKKNGFPPQILERLKKGSSK